MTFSLLYLFSSIPLDNASEICQKLNLEFGDDKVSAL